jgi:hypothetical protein
LGRKNFPKVIYKISQQLKGVRFHCLGKMMGLAERRLDAAAQSDGVGLAVLGHRGGARGGFITLGKNITQV